MWSKLLFLALLWPVAAWPADYYVTQSGAGAQNGTSLGNAWSVANYNASSTPTGGDTVYFSGSITSTVDPGSNGSSAGSLLVLDFSAATLDTSSPRFTLSSNRHLQILGGTLGTGNVTAFNCAGTSSNILVANWTWSNTVSASANFFSGNTCNNLTISNNNVVGVESLYWSDTSTDITNINNTIITSEQTSTQSDAISFGYGHNMVIQGNKIIHRAPGNAANSRHNDCLQWYARGNDPANAPYGIIVRYNWIELRQASASDGNSSWIMPEGADNLGGLDACKIYGNVFVGDDSVAEGNNGIAANSNESGAVYRCYNNTFIRHNGPDNTVRFLSPGTCYFVNNVMQADASESGTFINYTMTVGDSDHNWFYNCDSPSSTFTGANGASNTDPLFVDFTNNDLTTQAGSPLRGAGDDTIGSEYNQGIAFGATWPNPTLVTRSAWDVGAYEYVSGGGSSGGTANVTNLRVYAP